MIIILSTADMIKLSGCWYYHQKRRCHPASGFLVCLVGWQIVRKALLLPKESKKCLLFANFHKSSVTFYG
jgi:hypothetical protein